MDIYIPETYEELVEKCKEYGFRGTFSIENDSLWWNVTKHIRLQIIIHAAITDEGYMEEWYVDDDGNEFPQGHWHPMAEEIFNDLRAINDTEIVILKKGPFKTSVILDREENLDKYQNCRFFQYEVIDE